MNSRNFGSAASYRLRPKSQIALRNRESSAYRHSGNVSTTRSNSGSASSYFFWNRLPMPAQ